MSADDRWAIATRPQSILWFERLVLASLVLGVGSTLMLWGRTAAAVERSGASSTFILGFTMLFFAAFFLLLWFITRRRSRIAAWIYVALSAISIVTQLLGFSALLALEPLSLALALVQLALAVASLVLLGKRESRDWLAGRDKPRHDEVFD